MCRSTSYKVELKGGFGKNWRCIMDTFRRVYHHAQKWRGALSRRKRVPDDDEKLISPEAELDRINSFPVANLRIRGEGRGRRLDRRNATRKSVDFDTTKASMSLDLDHLAREANRTSISPDEWSLTEYRVLGKNGMTEISEVCKYLGLPGPEFLGIGRDAWDAALSHSAPADSTWEMHSPSCTVLSSRFSIRNSIRKRKDNASRLSLVVPSDMSHGPAETRVVRDKVSSDSNLAAPSFDGFGNAQLDRSESRHRDTASEGSLNPASVVTRETPTPGLVASSSSDGTDESIRRGSATDVARADESHEQRGSEDRQDVGRAQDSKPGSLATSSLPISELNLPSSAGATHAVDEVADNMTAGGRAGTSANLNSNTDSRAPLAETSERGETRQLKEGQRRMGLDLEEGTTSSAGPGLSINLTPSPAAPVAEVKQSRSSDDDEIRIQELLFPDRRGDLLGAGSLGTVYEALDRYGNLCAMKEVCFSKGDKNVQKTIFRIQQGVELLSGLKHKNIVQYLGTQRADGKIFIFQELVRKGSLVSLCKKVRFTNSLVIACTRQILKGLEYLHSVNIVHRDIKCANVLIDVHGTCKLADFGLANQISALEKIKFSKGSGYWMAPEVIDPKKTSSQSADIWSVGCTVLEMFTGSPPFGDMEWYRVMWKVGHGEAPPIPEDLSDDAKDFIRQCLRLDPAQRPTASMLLQHKFILTSLRHTISVN